MQIQNKSAIVTALQLKAVIDLLAHDHPRGEVESMVMDCRVLEACPARQLRVPNVEPLVAFELDLDEAQAMQGDFVRHHVVDDTHERTFPCRYSG